MIHSPPRRILPPPGTACDGAAERDTQTALGRFHAQGAGA